MSGANEDKLDSLVRCYWCGRFVSPLKYQNPNHYTSCYECEDGDDDGPDAFVACITGSIHDI